MSAAGSLEFAHARLCARLGERADESVWRRIEVVRDVSGVLEIVRASSLAPCVAGVGPVPDAHALEIAARRRWRVLVDEVAGWMPPAWAPAVRWCAALVDLPACAALGRREPLPTWLTEDPVLHGLTGAGDAGDPALAALVRAGAGDPRRVRSAWQAQWCARLPAPLTAYPLLQRLVQVLEAHAERFAHAHPADAWALRRGLAARALLLFRRAGVDPAQAFAFLALAALDYERLRGELVPRALLPQRTLAA